MGKYTKSEELVGKVFKTYTVEEVIENEEIRGRLLKVKCTCGKEDFIKYSAIKIPNVMCECQKLIEQKSKIGEKYNLLTIQSTDIGNLKNVLCKCDCGNIKSINYKDLLNGNYKSCGCLTKSKPSVGEVYNSYTIIEDLPPIKYGNSRYKRVKARCECGEERELCHKDLKKGKVKSCGCKIRENILKLKDGDVFNDWTVISEGNPYNYKGKKIRTANVRCKCGKIKYGVFLASLVAGKSKSCGCKGLPPKEKVIKEVTPIPISTEEEQWKEAFGFEGYYVSDKGRVFSTMVTNKYLNTLNKTRLDLNSGGVNYRNFNISKVVYQTFIGDWDDKEFMLIFIDDDVYNSKLENLFLSRITNLGNNWLSKALASMHSSSIKKGNRKNREINVTKKDLIELYEKQNGLSTFLKLPLDLSGENKLLAVSVDRIDNSVDYEPSNITLVTRFENMGRGNNTFEDFMKLCNTLKCVDL